MFSSMNINLTPISRDHNKKLVKTIQTLLSYEQSNLFRKPIPHKSWGWQDYKEIVKKPMDLNLVRRQYNEGKYKSVQQFLDQIQTVWDNVFVYGKKQHQTFELAIRMQKYFDDLLNDLFLQHYQKINRTTYFKQFQTRKPEKKSAVIQNQEKNSLKVEKMSLQNNRQGIQAQNQVLVCSQNRKKETGNARRLPGVLPILKQQSNKQIAKRNLQNQQKPQQKPTQITQQVNSLSEAQIVVPKQHDPLVLNSLIPPPMPVDSHLQNQSSHENQLPPVIVILNQSPSLQQLQQLTQMMSMLHQLQQFDTLSKVVKILTKNQKQNMTIDGQDVNFRINQIHISTYSKIKKQLQIKLNQLQLTQKFKQTNQKHIIQFNNQESQQIPLN